MLNAKMHLPVLFGMLTLFHGQGKKSDSGPPWKDCLREAAGILETVGQSTESEFLKLGEKLLEFHRRARKTSELSASVVELLAGDEAETAIDGLKRVVERVELLARESRRGTSVLREILNAVSPIEHQVDGFGRIAQNLRVLCISTRIESAHLGDRDIGFHVLSGDVEKLALEIDSKCRLLQDRLITLIRLMENTLANLRILETRQEMQVREMLDGASSALAAMVKQHDASVDGARSLGSAGEAVSQAIGEIVTSLQSHDITRQRIEHVAEALNGVASADAGDASGNLDLMNTAADICALEKLQIDHAMDFLFKSIGHIESGLRGVASGVSRMTEEAANAAGSQGEDGHSFLTELEEKFGAVPDAIKAFSASSREISEVMASSAGTLADMAGFAGEIDTVGTRIKLIALNAIVKAAHMGTEGATLGVLADSIHQLSLDTCRRTDGVSRGLLAVSASADTLDSIEFDGKDNSEATLIGDDVAGLIERLSGLNGRVASLLDEIGRDGRELAGEIESMAEGIDLHHRMEETLSGVLSRIGHASKTLESLLPPEAISSRADRLQGLLDRYTMEHEREVHQLLIGNGISPDSPEQSTALPENESSDEFGDNVELF